MAALVFIANTSTQVMANKKGFVQKNNSLALKALHGKNIMPWNTN